MSRRSNDVAIAGSTAEILPGPSRSRPSLAPRARYFGQEVNPGHRVSRGRRRAMTMCRALRELLAVQPPTVRRQCADASPGGRTIKRLWDAAADHSRCATGEVSRRRRRLSRSRDSASEFSGRGQRKQQRGIARMPPIGAWPDCCRAPHRVVCARGSVARDGLSWFRADIRRLRVCLVLEVEPVAASGPSQRQPPAPRRRKIDYRWAWSPPDRACDGRAERSRSDHMLRSDSQLGACFGAHT